VACRTDFITVDLKTVDSLKFGLLGNLFLFPASTAAGNPANTRCGSQRAIEQKRGTRQGFQ
jgi:hypothetical protein